MYILVSKILHVTVKKIFQWSHCTFSKSRLSLTHSRVNLYPVSSTKLFKRSSKIGPLVNPNRFSVDSFFVIMDEKVVTVFWESFIFIPLAYTVLSNKSWRSSKYFTSFCFFDNISTWASSRHQNFISEPSKNPHSLDFSCCQNKIFIRSLWM